jgi:hypothetical protein
VTAPLKEDPREENKVPPVRENSKEEEKVPLQSL